MTLLELQRQMVEDVRRPLTSDYAMQQATEDGHSMQDIAANYITPNARLTSFDRLEIYNRSYWFRAIDAVAGDFPALRAVLGEKRFHALVLSYLRENRSHSWTLRNLSDRLPKWLEANPDYTGRRHRLALDVARLEWAYIEAFDSLQMAPPTSDDLASLSPDQTLTMQPHLRLLELSYPVDELVLAVHRDTPEKDIVSNTSTEQKGQKKTCLPPIRRNTVFLAVHRFDDSVCYRRLDREAFLLLLALKEGATIADALQNAFVGNVLQPEEQIAKIQEYFAHAATLGWFCELSSDKEI